MPKNNIEIIELLQGKNQRNSKDTYTKPVAHVHEFYLSGEIESPENYNDWFDIIRHAGENDAVKIYINSPGGDLFTAIQFMRVLSETNATTIASVEGACMSAATMIFLCCEQFEVTPHSMFMFHNYSGGTIGKGGEMIDQLQHERVWSAKLLKEVYQHFLTETEINSMLDNKDLWMDGEQVIERLNSRNKVLLAMHQAAQEIIEAQETQPAQEKKTVTKRQQAKK
jgi:ATP-dependent protease ClpP protease subunit